MRPQAEEGGGEALVEAADALCAKDLEGTVDDAPVDGALARLRIYRLIVEASGDDICEGDKIEENLEIEEEEEEEIKIEHHFTKGRHRGDHYDAADHRAEQRSVPAFTVKELEGEEEKKVTKEILYHHNPLTPIFVTHVRIVEKLVS